jgi:hypothetical protein
MRLWLPMHSAVLQRMARWNDLVLLEKRLIRAGVLQHAMTSEWRMLDRYLLFVFSASCFLFARYRAARSGCIQTYTQTLRHIDIQIHRHTYTQSHTQTHSPTGAHAFFVAAVDSLPFIFLPTVVSSAIFPVIACLLPGTVPVVGLGLCTQAAADGSTSPCGQGPADGSSGHCSLGPAAGSSGHCGHGPGDRRTVE